MTTTTRLPAAGRRRRGAALALAATTLVAVAACGSDQRAEPGDTSTTTAVEEVEGGRGWLDDGSFDDDADGPEAAGGGAMADRSAADELAAEAPATTAVPGDPGTEPASDVGLRAGWVDDNDRWDDYLRYRQRFDALGIAHSPIVVEGRQVITVSDGEGRPVHGARVEVVDSSGALVAEMRTYADGRALFHAPTEVDPDSQSREVYTVRASKGEASETLELDPETSEHQLSLEASTVGDVKVDVLFLIDTTGSMSDEIARLQANITSVAEQVAELEGSPDVRFGMTVYRDRGDAFVTRTFDFTGDVGEFRDALSEVSANGGGDMPEDLNQGLHDALTKPAWRGDDTVKLVFLVADAPPHLDYADGPDYADDVVEAARLGVKIVPVASSGLDDQGEYVFRQMAQVTMGTFVFLTYGADGASPGDETTHDVDDYDVLSLDELVVRFVAEELAHQR